MSKQEDDSKSNVSNVKNAVGGRKKWLKRGNSRIALDPSFKAVNKVMESNEKLDTSFMDGIWKQCLEDKMQLPQLSLESKFWQRMTIGTLNVTDYGEYNVQDIAYTANAAICWAEAASKASEMADIELTNYLTSKFVSNKKYNDSMKVSYGVNPLGVMLNEATSLYMQAQNYVIDSLTPYYCPIADYACYQLWPWIGEQLKDKLKPDLEDNPNVYFNFVNDNIPTPGQPTSADKLAHQIGIYAKQGKIDKEMAYQIVSNCLYCEAYMAKIVIDNDGKTDDPDPMPFQIPFPKLLKK